VEGSEAVAVDPGGNPASVLKFLQDNGLTLKAILNTHLHFDHVGGNAALRAATNAPIYLNTEDLFLLDATSGTRFGLPPTDPFEYEAMDAGDVTFMGARCTVIHTPGHSPGSLSFYFPDQGILFSGDVLFHRDTGRSDLPGGSRPVLENETIRGKLYKLPDATVVYPGHGPETTIGVEKVENHWVRA
jgi:Zn-dependent hydrolases, including glyoxylases